MVHTTSERHSNFTGMESFVYPYRHVNGQTIPVNSLDELDCVNFYAFSGKKNMTRDFNVLVVSEQSSGDETIFLASQLLGTNARITHLDLSPFAAEFVKRRAENFGVAGNIRFLTGPIAKMPESEDATFDYVRCVNALDHSQSFHANFPVLLRFLKPDGVLGMSCLGDYGRETHRQVQELSALFNADKDVLTDCVHSLKELVFYSPERHWSRIAHENLSEGLRGFRDDAFVADYVCRDNHGIAVERLYQLLDAHGLKLCSFARDTRKLYQPWFATRSPEVKQLLERRTSREIEAISEIAWGIIERHLFLATRNPSPHVTMGDPANIPYFNPFVRLKKDWQAWLLAIPAGQTIELPVVISPEETFRVNVAWDDITRQMVEWMDGRRTIGQIVSIIFNREKASNQKVEWTPEQIFRRCLELINALCLEDVILLRHESVPMLPLAAKLSG